MVGYVLGPFFLITLVGGGGCVGASTRTHTPHSCSAGRVGRTSLYTQHLTVLPSREQRLSGGGCGKRVPLWAILGSAASTVLSLLQVMYIKKRKR